MVLKGYITPIYSNEKLLEILNKDTTQRKTFKMHRKIRSFLMNLVSYMGFEKISNKESIKTIYDSFMS